MLNINEKQIPKIDYISKIIIEASNPKKLAEWYTHKFGLSIKLEFQGEFHGGFRNNGMSFYIEIIPSNKKEKKVSNISLTFHVNNFKEYVHNLKLKHVIPYKTEFSHEGNYAFYRDLENNKIAILGTIN